VKHFETPVRCRVACVQEVSPNVLSCIYLHIDVHVNRQKSETNNDLRTIPSTGYDSYIPCDEITCSVYPSARNTQSGSKLLYDLPWTRKGNPDNNIESPCIFAKL
jgi:hypothetical protein